MQQKRPSHAAKQEHEGPARAMRMYVYVCMSVCMDAYVYMYLGVYISCVYRYSCVYVCVCIHVFMCVCMRMYTCMCVCMRMYTCIHVCIHAYVYMYGTVQFLTLLLLLRTDWYTGTNAKFVYTCIHVRTPVLLYTCMCVGMCMYT